MLKQPNSRWTSLDGRTYSNSREQGNSVNICQGDHGECTNSPDKLCACTEPSGTETEPASTTASPLTIARDYMHASQEQFSRQHIESLDFVNLKLQMPGMKIPAFKYALTNLGQGGKVVVNSDVGGKSIYNAGVAANSNIIDRQFALACAPVVVGVITQGQSCIFGSAPGMDPKIKAEEDKFYMGMAGLQQSRARPPYLVIDMDSMNHLCTGALNWNLTGECGMVFPLYENTFDEPIGDGRYLYKQPGNSWSNYLPDFGTSVLNLYNAKKVDPEIGTARSRLITSDSGRASVLDSFCGLVPRDPDGTATTLQRGDLCGDKIGVLLQGCDQQGPIPKQMDRIDSHHGQTCIHDHSCTLTMMGPSSYDLWVPAPGFWMGDIEKVRNDHKADDWGNPAWESISSTYREADDNSGPGVTYNLLQQATENIPAWWQKRHRDYCQIQAERDDGHYEARCQKDDTIPLYNTLPIQQLWRHHIDTDTLTFFYLPIGVFLQTFTSIYQSKATLNDFKYAPSYPLTQMGMWPMCPHDSTTFITNPTDAAKSRMVTGAQVAGGLGAYQQQYEVGAVTPVTCHGSETGIQKCPVRGWRSYRIGMMPGYTMDVNGCDRATQTAFMVQKNIYKCVDCTMWHPAYCRGSHECMYRSNIGINSNTKWQDSRFIRNTYMTTINDLSYMDVSGAGDGLRQGMSSAKAVEAAIVALSNEILEELGGDPLIYESVQPMRLHDAEKLLWNGRFERYAAGQNAIYETTLPVLVGTRRCDTIGTSAPQGYEACSFADNYDAFIKSVNTNMVVQEGLVVRPLTRMAYWTNKKHMMSHGIPSWSKHQRDPRQVFAGTLMDKNVQCKTGSKWVSVCSTSTDLLDSKHWPFIPWLGGAFNVFEQQDGLTDRNNNPDGGCDTTMLDTENPSISTEIITIDPSCQTPDCSEVGVTPLDSIQAKVCTAKQGQPPQLPTVSASHRHNMCTQRPLPNPSACNHPQGMLYGLQGRKMDDLHATTPTGVRQSPGELFFSVFLKQWASNLTPKPMQVGCSAILCFAGSPTQGPSTASCTTIHMK